MALIQSLKPGDKFKWNEWVIEVLSPSFEGKTSCRVIEGPWCPSIWWTFHSVIDVQEVK